MPEQKKSINHEVNGNASVQAINEQLPREIGDQSPSFDVNTSKNNLAGRQYVSPISKDSEIGKGNSDTKSLKVVVISLQGHEQAIEVDQVEEIIMAPQVSHLIKAPFFVEGVIRIRGKIVPIVDLKKAMRLPETCEANRNAVVIMARLWGKLIGFRVDSALELLTIPNKSIEPSKGIVGGVDARFIKGLTFIGDRFLVILDLEAMLSENREMILNEETPLECASEPKELYSVEDQFTSRRIISFILDNEIFGVQMGEVAEIMDMISIMPIPNVPDFVLGLINLRGKIVPVIDLRILFGLDCRPWTTESRIIIMKESSLLVGMVVDSMWESLRLSPNAFQPAPHSVTKIDYQYFRDISLVNGRVVSVLNISKILSDTAQKGYSSDVAQDLLVSGVNSRIECHTRGTL